MVNRKAPRIFRTSLSGLVVILVMRIGLGAETAVDRPATDPQLQSQIALTVSAIVDMDASGGENVVLTRVDRLLELTGGDRAKLLEQIVDYLSRSGGTEQSMAEALLFQYFAFTDGEKVGTALRFLETTDPALKRVIYQRLSTVDRKADGTLEFAGYLVLLRERADEPPLALIRYMYGVSPEMTIRTLRPVLPDGSYCESIDWSGAESLCGTMQQH